MDDRALHFVTPADLSGVESPAGALLALNNTHAQELGPLTAEKFNRLVREAFLARRIGLADAFLLTFDQDAHYDSQNFLWFRARYPRFIYVDRIVVASLARGRGCARRLYRDLFERAVDAGHGRVVCEVNLDPPNPASHAFHAALGFAEVGVGVVNNKTVRYYLRDLTTPTFA
jgi:predicted GNAT superfamily acetyltransferase